MLDILQIEVYRIVIESKQEGRTMKPVRGIQHDYIRDAKRVELAAVSFALFILGSVAVFFFWVSEIGLDEIIYWIGRV